MASETRLFGKWIREVLVAHGHRTNKAIGKLYGMSDVAAHKMTRECANPSISKAIDYMDPLGYALAVVPKGSELPEGGVYVAKSREFVKGGVNE